MIAIDPSRNGHPARLAIRSFQGMFASAALAVVLMMGASLAAAAPDRKAPTTPGNFRVTAKTSFRVSVAWTPSTDNSRNFTYLVWTTAGSTTVRLPQTATTYTFNTGFAPGNTYWFGIQAIDAAGNYSPPISISTTTSRDTTPPTTAPVVSVTDVGANYLSLSWTPAQDDGPYLFYQVLVNGVPNGSDPGTNRSITVRFLEPRTTYTIRVRARDYGNNWSPLSAPVTVTTELPNPNDTTAPTTPSNLREDHWGGGDTEINLAWDQSTDDFDSQANLRYDVYVNGVLQDVLFGSGRRSIVYGEPGENTVAVIATDTAGNASAPATVTVFF